MYKMCNGLTRYNWRPRRFMDPVALKVLSEEVQDQGDDRVPRNLLMEKTAICRADFRCQLCS